MLIVSRTLPDKYGPAVDRLHEIVAILPDGARVVFKVFPGNRSRSEIRVGIEAPISVKVLRGELYHQDIEAKAPPLTCARTCRPKAVAMVSGDLG